MVQALTLLNHDQTIDAAIKVSVLGLQLMNLSAKPSNLCCNRSPLLSPFAEQEAELERLLPSPEDLDSIELLSLLTHTSAAKKAVALHQRIGCFNMSLGELNFPGPLRRQALEMIGPTAFQQESRSEHE